MYLLNTTGVGLRFTYGACSLSVLGGYIKNFAGGREATLRIFSFIYIYIYIYMR